MADDDDDARALVVALLHRVGFETVEASDGDELLERVQRSDVGESGRDVVVSDIGMPGCDGIEVMRRLHRTKPQLPVVLMTAFRDLDTLARAHAAGAREVLAKPVDSLLLGRALSAVLPESEL